MRLIERDHLLWTLADIRRQNATEGPNPAPQAIPIDHLLLSYRHDQQTAAGRRRIETLLASSSAARRRLYHLAEVNLSSPPAELRCQLLSRARQPRRHHIHGSAFLALAATALLALGSWQLLGGQQPLPLPAQTSFTLVLEGGFGARRAADSAAAASTTLGLASVHPSSHLRFVLQPESEFDMDLLYGLYRQANGDLQRVTHGLHMQLEGGGAQLSISAANLLGYQPGDYQVFLVVGAGSLPSRVDLEPRRDPLASLSQDGLRRAYSQLLRLEAETSAAATY